MSIDVRDLHRASSVFRRWSVVMPGRIRGVAARAATILLEASRGAIPKKTGETAASLRVGLSAHLGGAQPRLKGNSVAMMLITGTRAHEIRPRNRQVLRFTTRGGDVVFARYVNHPGTKGRDWRRPAMAMARPRIRALGLDLTHSVIREIKGDAA